MLAPTKNLGSAEWRDFVADVKSPACSLPIQVLIKNFAKRGNRLTEDRPFLHKAAR